MKVLVFFLASIFTLSSLAQVNPAPGAEQEKSILLIGGTAHLGNGEIVEQAAVGFANGKLTIVADSRLIRIDRSAYDEIIDVSGKHIYPGFIALGNSLGLVEIGAVRATHDEGEVGNFKPHVRSAIAYNTDSRVIPTIRNNGILMVQSTPQWGTISGSSSVMHLDAWNWEDALVVEDDAIHLNWPTLISTGNWWEEQHEPRKTEQYETRVAEIRDFFTQARAYSQSEGAEMNLLFEAMRPVFEDKKKVFIQCYTAKEITQVIHFAQEFELDLVLMNAAQVYQVLDLVKQYDIPVVIDKVQKLPDYTHSDYDQPFKTPRLLEEAGITWAITVGAGWDSFWNLRTLPRQAGQAVAWGLDPEAAVASISGDVAEILGIDSYTGTLEAEKDATLFISEGDVLDNLTADVTKAWIQGREVDLDDKQKQLARKYEAKYGLDR